MTMKKRKKKKQQTVILPITFEVIAPWTWSKEFRRGWDEAIKCQMEIWARLDSARMTHKKTP